MPSDLPFLNASDAAARLGVSAKALRLYEQHGLLTPGRTAAGYRTYDADVMVCAARIVRLRALGLGLAQIARALDGDSTELDAALAGQAQALEQDIRDRVRKLDRLHALRADVAMGQVDGGDALARALDGTAHLHAGFALPWPWGGEWFELRDVRPINYLVGALGSGKTRLAMQLARSLPRATFLGLHRLDDDGIAITGALHADAALAGRVDEALAWLVEEGATSSRALTILLAAIESDAWSAVVVDLVEAGLDEATQTALMA